MTYDKKLKNSFLVLVALFALLSWVAVSLSLSPSIANAAPTRITNDEDCASANGIWDFKAIPDENGVSRPDSPNEWNGCWLKNNNANKKLCENSSGKWQKKSAFPAGVPFDFYYCDLPTDLELDNAAAIDYCRKYKNENNNEACKDGYVDLEDACDKYPSGDARKACQDGAKNSVYAIVEERNNNSDTDTGIGQDFDDKDCAKSADKLNANNCEVIGVVVLITNILAGLAATVIVAMIIVGGIQYSMAGAEASKVQAAKQKIINALLALLLLVFGFSIIQWLVPGGLI